MMRRSLLWLRNQLSIRLSKFPGPRPSSPNHYRWQLAIQRRDPTVRPCPSVICRLWRTIRSRAAKKDLAMACTSRSALTTYSLTSCSCAGILDHRVSGYGVPDVAAQPIVQPVVAQPIVQPVFRRLNGDLAPTKRRPRRPRRASVEFMRASVNWCAEVGAQHTSGASLTSYMWDVRPPVAPRSRRSVDAGRHGNAFGKP